MAHFAELDQNSTVIQVLVVDNDRITDETGQEQESLGITFLQQLLGTDTRWVQTSFNARFRGKYAGIGDTYDPVSDTFISPVELTPPEDESV